MANTADIQVQTEYLSVDAREKPLKLVRDKLALELLYHGGLAAERLGIEGVSSTKVSGGSTASCRCRTWRAPLSEIPSCRAPT